MTCEWCAEGIPTIGDIVLDAGGPYFVIDEVGTRQILVWKNRGQWSHFLWPTNPIHIVGAECERLSDLVRRQELWS